MNCNTGAKNGPFVVIIMNFSLKNYFKTYVRTKLRSTFIFIRSLSNIIIVPGLLGVDCMHIVM